MPGGLAGGLDAVPFRLPGDEDVGRTQPLDDRDQERGVIIIAGARTHFAQWPPGGEAPQHGVGVLTEDEPAMSQGVVPDQLIGVPQQRTAR